MLNFVDYSSAVVERHRPIFWDQWCVGSSLQPCTPPGFPKGSPHFSMLLGLPRSCTTRSLESPIFTRSKFLERTLARTTFHPPHIGIAIPAAAIAVSRFLNFILDSSLVHVARRVAQTCDFFFRYAPDTEDVTVSGLICGSGRQRLQLFLRQRLVRAIDRSRVGECRFRLRYAL
jgi:hypothetical protein